jgi:hypothetical protein
MQNLMVKPGKVNFRITRQDHDIRHSLQNYPYRARTFAIQNAMVNYWILQRITCPYTCTLAMHWDVETKDFVIWPRALTDLANTYLLRNIEPVYMIFKILPIMCFIFRYAENRPCHNEADWPSGRILGDQELRLRESWMCSSGFH